MSNNDSSYQCYLSVLGVDAAAPSLDELRGLVRAHLERVPFENVSKLHYLKTRGLRHVPDLSLFVDGIKRYGFGGTCYSNNRYLGGLLGFLGYEVALCGADMNEPDVHNTLVVRLDGREYLVDVGYAAPFSEPMPRDLEQDLEIALGNERWVLRPPDSAGRSAMEHHREGEIIHGYLVKPRPRTPEFFRPAILDSFSPGSTFMESVRLVRFDSGESVGIANLKLIHATADSCSVTMLADQDDVVQAIEHHFGIPPAIAGKAIAGVSGLSRSLGGRYETEVG